MAKITYRFTVKLTDGTKFKGPKITTSLKKFGKLKQEVNTMISGTANISFPLNEQKTVYFPSSKISYFGVKTF